MMMTMVKMKKDEDLVAYADEEGWFTLVNTINAVNEMLTWEDGEYVVI